MEKMRVPRAVRGSWESVLHEASARDKLLLTRGLRADEDARKTRGHRAIGAAAAAHAAA